MEINNNQSDIATLIKEMLKLYHLEDGYLEANISNIWEKIAGDYLYKHTTGVKYNKGVLIIRVNSAAIRSELQYTRSNLLEIFNKELGDKLINKIMIY